MGNHIESFAQNIPIIGHLMSAVYGLRGDDETAQKTAMKATIGIIPPLSLVNPIADVIMESDRTQSSKKYMPKYLRSHPNWMANYEDRLLSDLWIAGSNGSATYCINKQEDHIFGGNWCKLQTHTIQQQLNAGIRFLDLKLITKCPKRSYSKLNLTENEIYISNIHKGETFKSILLEIIEFIDKHSTEIVLLHIDRDINYHKDSINYQFHFLPILKTLIEICGDRLISAHNDGIDRKSKTIKQLTLSGTKGRILLLLSVTHELLPNLELYQSYCGWNIVSKHNQCLYPSKWQDFAMQFWNDYERDCKYWDFILMHGECVVDKEFVNKYITGQFGGALKGITSLSMDEQFENIEEHTAATNYQLYKFLNEQDFAKKKRKLIITHNYIDSDIIKSIIDKNTSKYTK